MGYILCELCDTVDHVLISGVIHENIDGAHLLHSLIDNLLAVLLLSDISGEKVAFLSLLFHHLLRVLGVLLFFGQVRDKAVGALHGVQYCDSTTDAGVASGDDGFLTL